MKVSVIIPNYNGKKILSDCLRALAGQSFADFETIVVDDASTDGSFGQILHRYPNVRSIRNDQNQGFAVTANLGIAKAGGEYIVLLNNDTEPQKDWLGELVSAADREEEAGSLASLVLDSKRPKIVDSAGVGFSWWGRAWEWYHGEAVDDISNDHTEVFGASASAALYKRSMLDDVGLFDEDFEAYYEDVDLSFRAQLAGYHCHFVPTAKVLHKRSISYQPSQGRIRWLAERNKEWVIVKNYPDGALTKNMGKILLTGSKTILDDIIHGYLLTPLRAEFSSLVRARDLLRKRRSTQLLRRVSISRLNQIISSSHPRLGTL